MYTQVRVNLLKPAAHFCNVPTRPSPFSLVSGKKGLPWTKFPDFTKQKSQGERSQDAGSAWNYPRPIAQR